MVFWPDCELVRGEKFWKDEKRREGSFCLIKDGGSAKGETEKGGVILYCASNRTSYGQRAIILRVPLLNELHSIHATGH